MRHGLLDSARSGATGRLLAVLLGLSIALGLVGSEAAMLPEAEELDGVVTREPVK